MKHASLFSGIGGPEVAAAMLGWENVFHCEINPFGRKVLEYWFPEWRGKVDVLTGGFPCQPFSIAGKRGGAEDARYVWPEMLRAIDEIRPAWVVGENVAGLATMVEGWLPTEVGRGSSLFEEGDFRHDWIVEQTYTIERIARDLEGLGYSVQPVLIPAAACGAPHRRDRIFLLASRGADRGKQDGSGESILGTFENSERDGRGLRADEIERSAGDQRDTRAGNHIRVCKETGANSTNPDGSGLQESLQTGKREDRKKASSAADDRIKRLGRYLLIEKRWRNFPVVSPIHRGNDGLPFNVDDLSIPFSRWRTESLKAYGNAIVPQVMYRIFEAIQACEA